MRSVMFYRDQRGECPIERFLDVLPAQDAQKITWVLRLIEDLEVLPRQYFKKLVDTSGIWEVRARSGANAFRLLCFFSPTGVVVVTNGFRKKTKKTPRSEIQLAESRKADWIGRNR